MGSGRGSGKAEDAVIHEHDRGGGGGGRFIQSRAINEVESGGR